MKKHTDQYCNNFERGCRNLADRRDDLCRECRLQEENTRRSEQKIEQEYWRENQKPHKPNYFREIEHGAK